MAIYFPMVGLEIKREFIDGHLRAGSDRLLPLIAAAGGMMMMPAIIFLFVTSGDPMLAPDRCHPLAPVPRCWCFRAIKIRPAETSRIFRIDARLLF